jgi:hypothetical protein
MGLDFDTSDFEERMQQMEEKADKATAAIMDDVLDDLVLYSSNIAPIDTGLLRGSHTKEKKEKKGKVVGEVSYSAIQDSLRYGMFNYALWTHEYMSRAKSTGSFEGYHVGNKYLYRPLIGEFPKWMEWWSVALEKEFRS